MSLNATARSLTLVSAFAAMPAGAVDLSVSGFGTLGYARSGQRYSYHRFIDDGATLRRDSVAGAQVDAKFGERFGATLQIKAGPASASDGHEEASIAWAFLAYRPSNDWLIRAGKQRIPLYLYSETHDVGVTYDFARLPIEMYSLVPSNDATGLSFSRNWTTSHGDFVLDGYLGKSQNDFRFWVRNPVPSIQSSGAQFWRLEFRGGGLVLSYRSAARSLRVGLHRAVIRRSDGGAFATDLPFVSLAPGVGYYQVDPALPGPGVPTAGSVTNTTLTLGAEAGLPAGLRFIGEFARSVVPHSKLAPQGNRGYASLLWPTGHWTPYVSYAFLRSPSSALDLYDRVNGNRLPPAVPDALLINALQSVGADQIIVFDQHSWALGTSYSFSPASKLKAELMRTRIGRVSKLVDALPGSDVRGRDIDVLTFAYSVVF